MEIPSATDSKYVKPVLYLLLAVLALLMLYYIAGHAFGIMLNISNALILLPVISIVFGMFQDALHPLWTRYAFARNTNSTIY